MTTGIKKYMASVIAVCIGCATLLLGSCNKLTDNKSSEKSLISFSFKKDNNTWLPADIVGAIDQASNTVSITVPESAYKYDDPSKK